LLKQGHKTEEGIRGLGFHTRSSISLRRELPLDCIKITIYLMYTLKDCLTSKYNKQYYYIIKHTIIVTIIMLLNSGR